MSSSALVPSPPKFPDLPRRNISVEREGGGFFIATGLSRLRYRTQPANPGRHSVALRAVRCCFAVRGGCFVALGLARFALEGGTLLLIAP